MPGVPWEKIEHSLNVSPTAKLIKQKLHRFAQDKKEAIRVEIPRLLAAGFIKKVYHLEWLANLVLEASLDSPLVGGASVFSPKDMVV